MNYTSKLFHFQYIDKYTLIVKANFFYDVLHVVDEQGQLLVYIKHQSNQPSEEALKILSLPFKRVYVTIPNHNLTFIPDELFDQNDLDKYQDFMEYPSEKPVIENLDFLNIKAIYQHDVILFKRWKSLFPQAEFIPEFKLNLKQARSHVPLQGEVLGVVFHDESTDIFLFINGQFKFFNSFEVVSEDDLSYFILNLFKVFGIEGRVSRIVSSGVAYDDRLVNHLNRYSNDIVVLKSANQRTVGEDMPQEACNEYILDLPTCV